MQVITCKLHGKMAHFRKFYSNSTALSYYLPPVTTVKGILAGLLGMERDSYYELFANAHCKVAIGVDSLIKKTTQTMNLLKVESLNDLNGAGKNRTQNNTEWVIPQNIRTGDVCYRITLHHTDAFVMAELAKRLCTESAFYLSSGISLALGSSQCLGWISDGAVCQTAERRSGEEIIPMSSAVPLSLVAGLERQDTALFSVLKEETITEFAADRYITENSKQEILLSASSQPLMVHLKDNTPYWQVGNSNLLFLA